MMTTIFIEFEPTRTTTISAEMISDISSSRTDTINNEFSTVAGKGKIVIFLVWDKNDMK